MDRTPATRRTGSLVAFGTLALAAGVLVYLTGRDPAHAWLIPAVPALAGHDLFGPVGQWLPSFVHPFAFGLFTAALLRPTPAMRATACASWFAIDVAFEFAQHPACKPFWSEALRLHAESAAIPRAVMGYALRGTFDAGDLLAIGLGAASAACLLHIVDRRREARHAGP